MDFELHVQEPFFTYLKSSIKDLYLHSYFCFNFSCIVNFSFLKLLMDVFILTFHVFFFSKGGEKTIEGRCALGDYNKYDLSYHLCAQLDWM